MTKRCPPGTSSSDIARGWIKARNFRNSKKMSAYAYLLMPSGIEEKARITARFRKQPIRECEQIRREIGELEREVANHAEPARREAGSSE